MRVGRGGIIDSNADNHAINHAINHAAAPAERNSQ